MKFCAVGLQTFLKVCIIRYIRVIDVIAKILNLYSSIRLGFCGYRFCHTRVLLSGIHVARTTWIPAESMWE